MSILSETVSYLHNLKDNEISTPSLIHAISIITRCSKDSVKGCLLKNDLNGQGLYTVYQLSIV